MGLESIGLRFYGREGGNGEGRKMVVMSLGLKARYV